jgi:hypothetical protein
MTWQTFRRAARKTLAEAHSSADALRLLLAVQRAARVATGYVGVERGVHATRALALHGLRGLHENGMVASGLDQCNGTCLARA